MERDMLTLRLHGHEPRHEKCPVSHKPANRPMVDSQMPKLCILNPCMFHAGLLNQEEKDKKDAAERKAKESA